MNELQQNVEAAAFNPAMDAGEIPAVLDRREGDIVLETPDAEKAEGQAVQVEADFQ